MIESIWPRSQKSLVPRDAILILKFISRKQTVLSVLEIAALIAIYVIGIHWKIPGVVPKASQQAGNWWFLILIDEMLTGGAVGRRAVFALGNFAIPFLAIGIGGRKGLFSRGIALLLLAVTFTGFFAARGDVLIQWRALSLCMITLATGGWIVYFIDKRLLSLHAPDVLHLNVYLMLGKSILQTIKSINSHQEALSVTLVAALIILMLVATFYLFRDSILIEVINIRTAESRRKARLALRSLNETSLEMFGIFGIMSFVCIAGLFSILLGWRNLGELPYWSIVAASIPAFTAATLFLGFVRRKMSNIVRPIFPEFGALIGPDPSLYAQRMMDNFWVIEGVSAGKPTEEYIERQAKGLWKKTLLFLSGSFLLACGIEFYSLGPAGTKTGIYPFGPFVFVALLGYVAANISMIAKNIISRFNGFRHISEGQRRLLHETAPSGAAQTIFIKTAKSDKGFEVNESDYTYFNPERQWEQLQELFDWYHLARQYSGKPSPQQTSARLGTILRWVTVRLVAGAFFGAVSGFIYLALKPEGGDVWAVVVPFALAPILSLEAFSRWTDKKNAKD